MLRTGLRLTRAIKYLDNVYYRLGESRNDLQRRWEYVRSCATLEQRYALIMDTMEKSKR